MNYQHLRDRKEDIPVNVDYEIDLFAQKAGQRVQFNKEAKKYLYWIFYF